MRACFRSSMSLQICKVVSDLWPACKMITGSARHSESNGGIERFNRTIQDKVRFSYRYIYTQLTMYDIMIYYVIDVSTLHVDAEVAT